MSLAIVRVGGGDQGPATSQWVNVYTICSQFAICSAHELGSGLFRCQVAQFEGISGPVWFLGAGFGYHANESRVSDSQRWVVDGSLKRHARDANRSEPPVGNQGLTFRCV
jgi:hypothetical protein